MHFINNISSHRQEDKKSNELLAQIGKPGRQNRKKKNRKEYDVHDQKTLTHNNVGNTNPKYVFNVKKQTSKK